MPFVEYLPSIALPALSGLDEGSRLLLTGWGDMLDTLAQRARDSARAALLDLCEDDALGAHAVASNLEPAKGETLAALRRYLQSRVARWLQSGTAPEMLIQLERLGYPRCEVVTWLDLALAGQPLAFGGISSFWYLIIRKPNPFGPPGKWGDGAKWGQAPYLWGLSGATVADLDEIRRIVRKWGPAGGCCRFIELVLAQDIFGAPLRTVRIPVYEDWQRQANGAYYDFYNHSFTTERT